jgi:hypothetical protein
MIMTKSLIAIGVLTSLSIVAMDAAQAELLVAKGTKATLTVEYGYSAIGAKKDKYDPREWKVNRSLTLTAQFEAKKPQALAQLRAMEAGQLADAKDKQATAISAHKKMTPMMGDMMKIVEKCGENEACIEKEIEAYGNSMEMTPELTSAGKDIEKLSKVDGPRYQLWSLVSQRGTYSIDEFYKGQSGDPLCLEKPQQRCRREETRKGAGDAPAPSKKVAGSAQFEVDALKKDIVIMLPVAMAPLPCAREVKSDFPNEASGSSQCLSGVGGSKPITVTIPGDLKQLSGTQQIKQEGAEGEGGMLTVRWTITVP